MRELIVQGAAAFFAIFGFAIILDMPKSFLYYAGAAGAVGWIAYLLALEMTGSVLMGAFLSSLAAALFSHIFARVLKTPVTVFLVAGILPAVPGASIYRCVYSLIHRQNALSTMYLMQTIQVAGGMALGIFIVDSLFRLKKKRKVWTRTEYKDNSDCGCSSRCDQKDDLPEEPPID